MVRDNVCPKCLGTMSGYYAEEGDIIVPEKKIICSSCKFVLDNLYEG